MRMSSGTIDQYIYFVAVDSTDFTTRKTGLSSFTVYRSRNGGTATAYTTPTIAELSSSNMPGVYSLLLDEDMTIDSGDDSQEMLFHITCATMAPVSRTIELYRPKITVGNTLDVTATGAAGIDWGNVENKTTSNNFSATTVNLTNTLTTYTGNTPQTGDAYARLGAPSGASVSADVLSVYGKVDTEVASIITTLGTAGAGLTAVASASNLAIVAGYIDTEIASIKAQTDLIPASPASTTNITAGTITTVTNLTNAPTVGDLTATMKASVTTAASSSTPAVTVSDKTGFSISGTIQTLDALNTAQNVEHDATQSAIVAAKAVVDSTKAVTDKLDTALELDGAVYRYTTNALEQAPTGGGAADGSGFTAIPWNPAWDVEVQSECADALTVYAPSTLTAVGVRTALGVATANLDTQLGDIPTVSEFNARTIVSADYATSTVATNIQSTVGDILVDTAEIGVAGAGLTNINLPNQTMDIVGNITGNLSGSVGSVTNRVTANVDQVAGSATAATNLSKSALGIVYGTAVTGTLSTTQMSTDLTETTNGHYIGRIIVWTSGALAGQATNITDYNGATKVVTYTSTTESPANGATWVMV